MWNGVHEIVTGGGDQSMVLVPWKRPSAATYVVEDLQEGRESTEREVQSSANATIDAASVTTNAAAGRGTTDPRVISVLSVAGITAGHEYAITGADGRYEIFRCFATSGTTIVAEQPIVGTYPELSTVQGVRVSGTFPAAEADDEDEFEEDRAYRVIWSLVIDGVQVPIAQPIRLVRAKFDEAYLGELELWLRTTWGDLYRAMGDYAEVRQICRFTAQRVSARLRKVGVDVSEFLAGPAGWDVLAARVILEAAQRGFTPQSVDPTSFLEDSRREWGEAWSNVALGADARDTVQVRRVDDTISSAQPRHRRRTFRKG